MFDFEEINRTIEYIKNNADAITRRIEETNSNLAAIGQAVDESIPSPEAMERTANVLRDVLLSIDMELSASSLQEALSTMQEKMERFSGTQPEISKAKISEVEPVVEKTVSALPIADDRKQSLVSRAKAEFREHPLGTLIGLATLIATIVLGSSSQPVNVNYNTIQADLENAIIVFFHAD